MKDKSTVEQENNNRRERLKPYQFKPGQSGNPKGRPKSILSKKERLELLSEMARTNKHKANPVEAIREQNRMEGIYLEVAPGYQDNRVVNIIVTSEEAKKLTENVGKRLLGESSGVIEGEEVDRDRARDSGPDNGH